MDIFAGMDVSDKTTHLCVVDSEGAELRRDVVVSDPDVLAKWLKKHCPGLVRVVLETGPLSTFLYHGLAERGVPVICICARHAKKALSARINKSDVIDAESLAQLCRTGWFKAVHMKAGATHIDRAALKIRAQMMASRIAFSNQLRGMLKLFGLKMGSVTTPGKRREQVGVLAQWLIREAGDALVLGDFNFGDGEENPQLAAAGLVDAWQAVHPHHPGFTFDPVANPLAALNSRSGTAARYDRVLLYSPGRALAPIDITMFGDRPFADNAGQGLFSSDHFGLCCLLQTTPAPADPIRQTLASATPVHHSALVVLPPERLRAAIDAIRAAHDPSHGRWMPHINLIYGFVPEALFAAAKAVVAASTPFSCASIACAATICSGRSSP